MAYFIFKTFITAIIVTGISELARRYTIWAALLASLPITSILAFIWVYKDEQSAHQIIELSYSVFWLVFPSLAFFLILPLFLKYGIPFGWAMLTSIIIMFMLYSAGIWVYKLGTQS